MKKVLFFMICLLSWGWMMACPVCERQESGLLRGITHGAGPDSQWDYLIISIMLAIVLFTLFFSVKWLLRPGEKSEQHIKRFILNDH